MLQRLYGNKQTGSPLAISNAPSKMAVPFLASQCPFLGLSSCGPLQDLVLEESAGKLARWPGEGDGVGVGGIGQKLGVGVGEGGFEAGRRMHETDLCQPKNWFTWQNKSMAPFPQNVQMFIV